jgi:hypothetical protein
MMSSVILFTPGKRGVTCGVPNPAMPRHWSMRFMTSFERPTEMDMVVEAVWAARVMDCFDVRGLQTRVPWFGFFKLTENHISDSER